MRYPVCTVWGMPQHGCLLHEWVLLVDRQITDELMQQAIATPGIAGGER